MKHKRKERLFGRWLALLLLFLLWGGGLPADAAERAWAKYDEATKTLTFYLGVLPPPIALMRPLGKDSLASASSSCLPRYKVSWQRPTALHTQLTP